VSAIAGDGHAAPASSGCGIEPVGATGVVDMIAAWLAEKYWSSSSTEGSQS